VVTEFHSMRTAEMMLIFFDCCGYESDEVLISVTVCITCSRVCTSGDWFIALFLGSAISYCFIVNVLPVIVTLLSASLQFYSSCFTKHFACEIFLSRHNTLDVQHFVQRKHFSLFM